MEDAKRLIQLGESQIPCYTDIVLIRSGKTGSCGQASCVFMRYRTRDYAISCQHILKPNSEYFCGAKRLTTDRIPTKVDHTVPPLKLVCESEACDLAVFTHEGLLLSEIPKAHYAGDDSPVDYGPMTNKVGIGSFILGAPGAFTQGTQYPDGLVHLQADLYSACGPIVSVEENRIVADFAEKELVFIDDKNRRKLKGLVPTGGARDLSGMSGSGLWVYATNCFHLVGILRGPEVGSDKRNAHRIEFTPIWKLRELLISAHPDQTSITGRA